MTLLICELNHHAAIAQIVVAIIFRDQVSEEIVYQHTTSFRELVDHKVQIFHPFSVQIKFDFFFHCKNSFQRASRSRR